MSRRRRPLDPESAKARAFNLDQLGRRAERRMHHRRRWAEYDDSNTAGGIALALLIVAGLLIAYVRLQGRMF